MPNLYLGPDCLRFEQVVIDRVLGPRSSGNYALGVKNEAGEFVPLMIGRSDTDLRSELTAKLATDKYPYFKFNVTSPQAAYEMECAQYHNFKRQLAKNSHPVPPEGSDMNCFLCGQ